MKYIVKEGDTLRKIADYYKIDLNVIKEYNNLNDDTIMEGMIINIPYETPLLYYKVLKGDNLYNIANKFGVSTEDLAKINGLNSIEYLYPEQELLVPKKDYKIYFTKKGDSLFSIANKLNFDINETVTANKDLYLVEEQLIIYKHSL